MRILKRSLFNSLSAEVDLICIFKYISLLLKLAKVHLQHMKNIAGFVATVLHQVHQLLLNFSLIIFGSCTSDLTVGN
jgi:hypothetical protein